MTERYLQSFEDVSARQRLTQIKLGATPHHLTPELQELFEHFRKSENTGTSADDGQHDHAESGLQWRVLPEIVQHYFRHFAPLQLNHDAHSVTVRFVPQICNSLNDFLTRQSSYLLEQSRLVDLVGKLDNNNRRPVASL